jgi:CRISPR-associated protein Cas2
MAMTVLVARDVPERCRGFLASCMCEIAPGVYTAPRLSKGVRERVWDVVCLWLGILPTGSVVMTWPDSSLSGGQAVRTHGVPKVELIDDFGIFLSRRDLTTADLDRLTSTPEVSET